MWLEPMNKLFPRLGDLFLFSTTTEEMDLMLPETLQAPDLCRLELHGIGLPKGLSLLSSTTALSTLSLTHIGASYYFPPGHMVTRLQGLPHLEELSIGFAIPIPLPSGEGELLPAPMPPVILPTLKRLTFRGMSAYLDNLVSQINTPLLEQLSPTLFFDLAFTLVELADFIRRTEGFKCLAAKITFDYQCAFINVDYDEWDIGKLSLRINCEPLDLQTDSTTQVCRALRKVLRTVEELTLGFVGRVWDITLDSVPWHELLLPFIGVKKLHICSSLAPKLSQALQSVAGELVMELLPVLQELEVQLRDYSYHAESPFSAFVDTRESVGRPVHLSIEVIEEDTVITTN
jgi:hypothetical protein